MSRTGCEPSACCLQLPKELTKLKEGEHFQLDLSMNRLTVKGITDIYQWLYEHPLLKVNVADNNFSWPEVKKDSSSGDLR